MKEEPRIVQIAHGKLIPQYSSAYAMRCIRYLSSFRSRVVFTTGGLIFHDETQNKIKQYRSILMTILAFLRGGRRLEIYLSRGKFVRKRYLNDLFTAVNEAEIVIFEGPWQYYLVKNLLEGKLVIYDAHNVEASLRRGDPWESYTKTLEQDLVKRSDHIITVSEEDKATFISFHGKETDKISCIPEGYERPACTWNGSSSKEIVFIGSAYLPNLEAAIIVIGLAEKMPHMTFKIIGSVCSSLKRKKVPKNVRLLGVIDEPEKEKEICNSLLAINPVSSGSGRNLKMLDYISHGIPIITTEIGARGFPLNIKETFSICNIEEFPEEIAIATKDLEKLKFDSSIMLKYAEGLNYQNTIEDTRALIKSLMDKV